MSQLDSEPKKFQISRAVITVCGAATPFSRGLRRLTCVGQNSEQFITMRPRHFSLRQITLHFSGTATAPQTGQTTSLISGDFAGRLISAEG
jgi:hypothetical protein